MAPGNDPRDRVVGEMRERLDEVAADIESARRAAEQDGMIEPDKESDRADDDPPTEVAPPG